MLVIVVLVDSLGFFLEDDFEDFFFLLFGFEPFFWWFGGVWYWDGVCGVY